MHYFWGILIGIAAFIGAYLATPPTVRTLANIKIQVADWGSINLLALVVAILAAVAAMRYAIPWLKKMIAKSK